MIILKKPLKVDSYDFQLQHLDCDCIVEEIMGDTVNVLAYAENKEENKNLSELYYSKGYNKIDKCFIYKAIPKSEVNSID